MSFPGSNILQMALSVIASQQIVYLAYVSRSVNSIGLYEDVYASPVTVFGSIQPVPRTLMQTLGLDLQKQYVNIFVPQDVVDIARDITSDKFQFSGKTYKGISLTAWHSVDGWSEILAIEVPE